MARKKKNKGGRPTIMTDKTVKKLEKAFMAGLSDRKACIFAEISHQTLYNYCNANPKFVDRKEALKKTPSIDAQFTIAKAVKKDSAMALKFLERRERKDWSPPTVKQDLNIVNEISDKTDEQLDAEIAAVNAELSKYAGGDND